MIKHNEAEQAFGYFIGEKQIAWLAYRYRNESLIDAYHTKVLPEFEGQGIASDLYNALIEFAQSEQLKIKPSCRYIQIQLARKNPEMQG